MGRSIWNVPRTDSYADALLRFESIIPIRNHVPERKPLAERRYHQTYWVRKNPENNAIEYMLYRTPVVTFLPDGGIEIRNGGYASQTTHGFIWQVLRNIHAGGYQNKTRLVLGGGNVLIGDGDVVRVARKEDGSLKFDQAVPDLYQYNMNRKAANTVRRRYKEFADYLKNFLGLRSVTREARRYNYQGSAVVGEEFLVVEVTHQEYLDVLGSEKVGNGSMEAVGVRSDAWGAVQSVFNKKRPGQEQALLALMTSDQPEEAKHENFYKAALAMCLLGRTFFVAKDSPSWNNAMRSNPEGVLKFFNTGLMVAHAKEVLTLTKLAPGKVPSKTYQGWVINEEK